MVSPILLEMTTSENSDLSSLILGTRGSELALAQATMTRAALEAAHPGLAVERNIIRTMGDKRPDLKLSEFSQGENPVLDKGIFTKELELALDAREIDAAVHSLKDVPTELEERFRITAVLPRAPIEDVLIFRPGSGVGALDGLKEGAVVATSSVRRRRQLEWLRPDLRVVDIRGNVPTRIRKLSESEEFDATMLAVAGLGRLGFAPVDGGLDFEGIRYGAEILEMKRFLPAAGQGAVGIEILGQNAKAATLLAAIDHRETHLRVILEREFLHLLKAGCQTPVGIWTEIEGGKLCASALVFTDDRKEPLRSKAEGDAQDPRAIAAILRNQLS
jgi:hydroxymethylbilane synthase